MGEFPRWPRLLALLALVAGLSGCDRGVPLTLEWPSGTLDCRGAIGGVDGSRGQTVVFFDAPSVVDIDAVMEKGDAGGSAGFGLGAGKRAVRFVWQGDSNTVVYARSGRARLLALVNGMNLPSDLSRHELHMRVKVDRSGRMTIAGSVDRRPPIDAVSPFSLLNVPLLVTVYTGGSGGHVFSYHVVASNS